MSRGAPEGTHPIRSESVQADDYDGRALSWGLCAYPAAAEKHEEECSKEGTQSHGVIVPQIHSDLSR